MANPSSERARFGLRPVRRLGGGPYSGLLERCFISENYATALFIGDPVLMDTTLANKDATARHLTVIRSAGTAGTIVWGAIVSFEADQDNLTLVHRLASTERFCWVVRGTDDMVWQIRDDGSGDPTKVFPGQNAAMVAGSGGSTATGLSSFALDATTPAATQNMTLWINKLSDIETNELGDNAVWDVLINTHQNATGEILGVTAT